MYRVLFVDRIRHGGKVVREELKVEKFKNAVEAVNFANLLRLSNGNAEIIEIRRDEE